MNSILNFTIKKQLHAIAHKRRHMKTSHGIGNVVDHSCCEMWCCFDLLSIQKGTLAKALGPRNWKKDKISFGDGDFVDPYKTLWLLILYQFSWPHPIRREMDAFFGFWGRTKDTKFALVSAFLIPSCQCERKFLPFGNQKIFLLTGNSMRLRQSIQKQSKARGFYKELNSDRISKRTLVVFCSKL